MPKSLNSLIQTSTPEYTFGATEARGNITLGLRLFDETYLNRSDVTDGQDLTIVSPFGRFSYRVSGDTRVFTELRFNDINID